jgi:transposase-like protein
MSAKNKFSPADKYKVALEAIRGELTQAQITAKHHVHATQIAKWKKQALEYLQAAFSNRLEMSKVVGDYEGQLAELYKQIGQLKVENDFLKKKCDVFE